MCALVAVCVDGGVAAQESFAHAHTGTCVLLFGVVGHPSFPCCSAAAHKFDTSAQYRSGCMTKDHEVR